MTLEAQYNEFLHLHPEAKLSFNEWKKRHSNQTKQALISMMEADEELGLYDEPKQETLNDVALKFAKDHHNLYETSNYGSMYYGFYWGAKWQQEQDRIKTNKI